MHNVTMNSTTGRSCPRHGAPSASEASAGRSRRAGYSALATIFPKTRRNQPPATSRTGAFSLPWRPSLRRRADLALQPEFPMSALSEIDFSRVAASTNQTAIRLLINQLFWAWYEQNRTRPLVTLRWWFLRKTLVLQDVEDIFVILFGPKNATSATL